MGKPIGPYSPYRYSGQHVYVSGQIALSLITDKGSKASIREEAEGVMSNLEGVLSDSGLTLSHIVKATIFLTDMNNFEIVNQVYSSYLEKPYPARSTIEVNALPKGANVKIECIAER